MPKLRTAALAIVAGLTLVAATAPAGAQDDDRLRPRRPSLTPADAVAVDRLGADGVTPPDDLTDPGDDAVREPSGLAWKRLQEGDGGATPGQNDTVEVEYVVWASNGLTVSRTPDELPLRIKLYSSIEGLREALTAMTVGESRRVWVPEALAYQGRPGFPAGDLVVDVTLRAFEAGPTPPPNLDTPPADAVATDSGLRYVVLEAGDGTERPGESDAADIYFSVWRPDGLLVHTTPGRPERILLDATLPGMAEALGTMAVGERRRLWMTQELATLPGGSNPPDTPLVMDVTLAGIQQRLERPDDYVAPAPDAEVDITGLATRLEEPGDGTRRPEYGDTVVVEYAGWTRDGKEFDSSFAHGRPGRFKLGDGMPLGFNETLMKMVVGERRIAWIPADMAYGDAEDRPQGMLIFNIRLVDIVDE